MEEFIPPWHNTKFTIGRNCASTQYTYIDNSAVGGFVGWVKMSFSLSNCVCFGMQKRCHLRIFDCVDIEPFYGNISLVAVHYEELNVFRHVIMDWDKSQKFIENLFDADSYSFVGSKNLIKLQPTGEILQGVKHDGVASVIELK